jgi:hypothetical protein
MEIGYKTALAPLVGSIALLISVLVASVQTLGIVLKYGSIIVTTAVITLYIYNFIYRGLTELGSLAWGDVLERHLDEEQQVAEEDIPHWSRIWVAYSASLVREWIGGNLKWVSFTDYYDDMVNPILEEINDREN